MKLAFWLCFALVVYAYLGYAFLLWLYSLLRQLPPTKAPFATSVTIVMAARNEESNLPAKLESLRRLDYPQSLLQIVVVSDGSTDRTNELLREHADRITAVVLDKSGGKAHALNEAVKHASGEILVMLDTRQAVDSDAVAKLVSCFADPSIGAVSGELLLEAVSGVTSPDALGLYWKIEKAVRKLESLSGSVVGVTGAIYAIRRELYTDVPEGTILDDVFIPMNVARKGKRVVFEPEAIARDRIFSEGAKEFSRKVRTLTGNYQLVRLAPWLLSPANPLLFRFISHKLIRLAVPFLLAIMLITSAVIRGPLYTAIFWLQILFYALAVLGTLNASLKRLRPVGIAYTFVMLNAAAVIAFRNFITDRTEVWI